MQMSASPKNVYYPNMGLMRYFLALTVLIYHFNYLTGSNIPTLINAYDAVGCFFAISGFLLAKTSEVRPSFTQFLKCRARRIMPSYTIVVLLSALSLWLLSTLPPLEYLSNAGLWQYLGANLTALNWLHPDLPGVFDSAPNVTDAVNGSLWTIKVEWMLYLTLPAFFLAVRKYNFNLLKTAAAIIILSIAYRIIMDQVYITTGNPIYSILGRQVVGQAAYFYTGVALYRLKRLLSLRTGIPQVSLMLLILAPYLPKGPQILSPIFLSFIVLALSTASRMPSILPHKHNVSYEMYLLHFPVIQATVALCSDSMDLTDIFIISLTATILLSIAVYVISNRLVRKK